MMSDIIKDTIFYVELSLDHYRFYYWTPVDIDLQSFALDTCFECATFNGYSISLVEDGSEW